MLINSNTSGPEDRLDMHALLQQMGRRIQKQLGNNSRVWLPMDPHNALKSLNTDRVGEVNMLVYRGEDGRKPIGLPRMPHLRYLSLENAVIVDNIRKIAPNLIWMKIRNCEFSSDMCTLINLRNRFHIDSWSQPRIFSLKQCASLKRIPYTLDRLVNLQCLYLEVCLALTTLKNTLGNMSQLKMFSLCGCVNLTSLPDTVGNLKQLQEFYLGGCANLKSFPRTIGNLAQLRVLNLYGCTSLKVLPETTGDLAQLKVLNLRGCAGLQKLPSMVGKLAQLRWLNIHGCSGLGSFEDILVKLAKLRRLNRCNGLGSLMEKRFNVYLGFSATKAREQVDRLYRSLRKASLRISRVLEVDQRGKTGWLYSKRSETPIHCTGMCETTTFIETSSEEDNTEKMYRSMTEAILNSDIRVAVISRLPIISRLPDLKQGHKMRILEICVSDGLFVPFFHEVEPLPVQSNVNPCLMRCAENTYTDTILDKRFRRDVTVKSVGYIALIESTLLKILFN